MEQSWLGGIRRYFSVILMGNLIWEFSHLPLYTIWETGTLGDLIFAAIHCTGGDMLIALASLVAALVLTNSENWPVETRPRLLVMTLLFGLGYTIFSEWLNIEVRQTWAYRDVMPVIPGTWIGLSPLLQWIVVPSLALWWASQRKPDLLSN